MALRKLRQIHYDIFCEECALGDRLHQIARQNSRRAPVDEVIAAVSLSRMSALNAPMTSRCDPSRSTRPPHRPDIPLRRRHDANAAL